MKKRTLITLCLTVLATLGSTQTPAATDGPDTFGYTWIDSYGDSNGEGGPVFNFEDISGTGSQLLLGDEEISGPVAIGFSFNFYGTDYTELHVSNDGFLSFLDKGVCCSADPDRNGDPIPTPGLPDAIIAAWWGDLDPSDPDSGGIYTELRGTAPHQELIIQFTAIPLWNRFPEVVTFQYKLFEGSDVIEVHYERLNPPVINVSFSAGIEDQTGEDGLEYLNDDEVSHDVLGNFIPVAVRYSPPAHNPDCAAAVASVDRLWPPNHKFVPIQVLGVSDPEGDPVTITIDSIYQDEPLNTFGDGNTSPDGRGIGTAIAEVRAERSGTKKVPGDGRVYHIGFTASNGGGQCNGSVTVGVPHDQGRKGRTIIDGGALYDSTQ